ncbi:FG-GAP-like repeat-containing protein, partial [Pelagibius sp. Alg239-R121]|uniref:FG-GAP-like repeat-containing protein n=1 Tax=Pelagibius sp. Alg239-R121 TaxID=2993448 RepID=UPI0024A66ED2
MLFSAVAAASLLIGGASASAQTTVAGVTPGAIAVDESGSANYSIPLSVPPGVAGMAPSLSLIYGSRGDNGILGVGWSLGGLSVIHRCGKTIAQDDTISGVNYSANDRFCLDGQRLVATDGGTYGADGTVYSTELASFSKIVSYGTAGNGPATFKVWTKSGQIMTYGDTADSAVEVPGQADIRYWSVNRIEDRVGNYLDLSYSDDTTNNVHQIDRIDYAGNTVAGTLPRASVRFVYEGRTDTRVHYMAGTRTQTLNRLKSIETYATFSGADTLVKRYDMAYEYGPETGRSRLTSLTECDANNNCLEPHSFTYQGDDQTHTDAEITNLWGMSLGYWSGAHRNLFTLDYNGDGLTDVLLQGKTTTQPTYLLVNNGNGFDPVQTVTNSWGMSIGYWSGYHRNLFPLDINGDGLTDILLQGKNTTQPSYLLINNGNGFDTVQTVTNNWGMSIGGWSGDHRKIAILDLNGDGRSDILLQGTTNTQRTYFLISNGSGFNTVQDALVTNGSTIAGWAASLRNLVPFDYNGDGMMDVLLQGRSDTQQSYMVVSNGNGFEPAISISSVAGLSTASWSATRRSVVPFDYNGDGLSDLLMQGVNGSRQSILLINNGNGFEQFVDLATLGGTSTAFWGQDRRRAIPIDYNGDGLDDVFLQGNNKDRGSYLLVNNGDGFNNFEDVSAPWGLTTAHWAADRRNFFTLDANGDGATDILLQAVDTKRPSRLLTADKAAPDLLISANDGLGRVASITYKSLTDATVYTKGSAATFPEIDIQAPMYVVSSVSQDDGKTETPGNLEGQAVINYSYAGAKVNTEGRGFLGFRTVTARDEQTGILTTTTYNQTYPFTGQVDSSVTRLDNGLVVDLVKEVSSTYASKEIFDGTLTNQPSVLFPYADLSTSKAYEISRQDLQSNQVAGFLVSSTTTTSTYDDYGNALSITQSVTDETTGATGGQVFTTQTTSLYDNDETKWILGRVTSTTVTKTRPGAPNQSRKSAWEYDSANGLLTKEIIEPDIASLKVTASYTYDAFGNETAVTVSGQGVTSRSSTTSYDSNGQFPLSSANALNHSESMVTDARFGVVASLTGPNGITTTWEYDGFGRKTKELRADGTESRITYALCNTS